MSKLLNQPPYAERDDEAFLAEMNSLTRFHLDYCPEYKRIWSNWRPAKRVEELPFVHVGVFKHLALRTQNGRLEHQRILNSSGTTASLSSRIALDESSGKLQGQSTHDIISDFIGKQRRPLIILDSAKSLRMHGEISARIAAAMSLRLLAEEVHFVLNDVDDVSSMKWDEINGVLDKFDSILVYGFTSILWRAWAAAEIPAETRARLAGKFIYFLHSGGWKKLEAISVNRSTFNSALLEGVGIDSKVVDFYGLVEQNGVIFPACDYGFRHVPRWAAALVRDTFTGVSLETAPGQLQLMNTLAHGAPYHNVLTEDVARLVPDNCPCGRLGQRFELIGRLPRAEIRGCANA